MRMLVDENVPRRTVEELRGLGHDVLDVRGTSREGSPDDELWRLAQRECRLVITGDKGFTQHRGEPHYGLLVIRLRQPNLGKFHHRVLEALRQHDEADWPGLLVVMRDVAQSTWRRREDR